MAVEFLNNFKIPDYILVPESKVEKIEECGLLAPKCPVLVFVNSKSGGQLGGELLQTYRTLLNEKQVFLYVYSPGFDITNFIKRLSYNCLCISYFYNER